MRPTISTSNCIQSNQPSASDTELCFTLWQLKWCRKSNDKTVYSKFQNLSLVVFDINISVSLSHVSNIGSVLVACIKR
jgi:hypothetical protein